MAAATDICHGQRREFLKVVITRAFDDSDGTYGYRRVHAQLARWDVHCTPELVHHGRRGRTGLLHANGARDQRPRPRQQ
ncbi:MAG TPA: transposase [Candidatus Ruania gallistercoris]|uniref:Transposase n=1 Tax=Candidatus Ruania gallistercoris TaxID=2838746 RepID=A0A9D2J4S8_9MICO|nr:transposase [Candidatus Ruania gallistercoris]